MKKPVLTSNIMHKRFEYLKHIYSQVNLLLYIITSKYATLSHLCTYYSPKKDSSLFLTVKILKNILVLHENLHKSKEHCVHSYVKSNISVHLKKSSA